MPRFRGTLIAVAVTAGSIFVPAQKSEAGIFCCLRRVFNRCAPCDPCATPVVGCPEPVVQEGSYCNPCANPCSPCTTSYVRRTYLAPQTCYQTRCAIEAQPVVVRRSYWDPCECRYKCYYETATTYVRRSYSVPVTNYVQRSYLEPVTTCTPQDCPTPTCPTSPYPTSPYPVPGATEPTAPSATIPDGLEPVGPMGRRQTPTSTARSLPVAGPTNRPRATDIRWAPAVPSSVRFANR